MDSSKGTKGQNNKKGGKRLKMREKSMMGMANVRLQQDKILQDVVGLTFYHTTAL